MKTACLMRIEALSLVLLFLHVVAIGQSVSLPKSQHDKPVAIQAEILNFSAGRSPEAILFDGTDIWVANQFSDNLMKLSARDGSNLGTFPTGTRPVALAYDGENIWVANKFSDNVMKFRARDGNLLDTIQVGKAPEGLAFDGSNIWVANGGDGTVTKLRPSDGASCTYIVGRRAWRQPKRPAVKPAFRFELCSEQITHLIPP